MAMYAHAVTPLINSLCHHHPDVSQAWFVDDATAAGQLTPLLQWSNFSLWAHFMVTILMSPKHTLLLSHNSIIQQNELFWDTNVQVSCHGQCHLGAAIGTQLFTEEYVSKKSWSDEILTLSSIATTHPHNAYCVFVHGVVPKWKYVM